MKSWWCGLLLATGVATAACGASPQAPRAPDPPPASESILTIEPTPVVTVTVPATSSAAATTSATVPATTKKAPVRKTPTRKPPQYGYQCRDGDETKFEVCAGHKAWIDGQREFTDCLNGGGTWDIDTQRCVRP
ncbi:hypothetical protein [Amycolatopsis sp. NPDC098790]|uniref:hypothetical protein n=1 Tax=Amycolatopsis sp. NPDC098790 TaxID=3363939 RepID=UPI00380BD655